MKASYLTPSCEAHIFSPHRPVLSVSGNSWNESLQNTGSDWGGLDTDESVFGL